MPQGPKTRKRRGRKREAQRWIDLLAVRCTRIPAAEGFQRWCQGKEHLKAHDLELFEVAHGWLDDIARTDPFLTMDEWRIRAVARSRRVEKLRATLAKPGRLARGRSAILIVLACGQFLTTAEVAERQTR